MIYLTYVSDRTGLVDSAYTLRAGREFGVCSICNESVNVTCHPQDEINS